MSPQSVQELSEAAKRAINPTASMRDVVAQSGRNLIARKNLRRLLNGQETKEMWLDDEVINCYFGQLMARANANRDLFKLYCFTSHLFKFASPDLCARKDKIFDMDVILIPVNVTKSHWVLVSVFPSKKKNKIETGNNHALVMCMYTCDYCTYTCISYVV